MPNESVGKVLLTSETEVFGGHLTYPSMRSLIVAHYVSSFFSSSRPRICLTTFSTDSTTKISGGCKPSAEVLGGQFVSQSYFLQGNALLKASITSILAASCHFLGSALIY